MDIKQWVKDARSHAKLTQEQLGERLNVTKGNVSGWENGRHRPGYDQLLEIERVTGYRLRPTDLLLPPASAAPTMQPILAWEHEDDLPPGQFVMIPRLDIRLSAGNGHEQVSIEFVESQPQAFRADWIRARHLKPKKLAAMTADGDSMEPGIFHGDSLLVDTSQNEVVDGKVYALWYDGGERVKRLFRVPGGALRIQSDNPKHPTFELPAAQLEHVRIIGRVVLRSGEGGL